MEEVFRSKSKVKVLNIKKKCLCKCFKVSCCIFLINSTAVLIYMLHFTAVDVNS